MKNFLCIIDYKKRELTIITTNNLQLTFRDNQWIITYKCVHQDPRIKCCTFPPTYNVCEFHVEITSCKYILRGPIFSSTKMRSIGLRYLHTYMGSIYGPKTILRRRKYDNLTTNSSVIMSYERFEFYLKVWVKSVIVEDIRLDFHSKGLF